VHVVAVEALDAGRDPDPAVVDEVQELGVDHRAVAVQVARRRGGQPVALGRAEGDVDDGAGNWFLDSDRQAGEQRQLRARAAVQRLGLEDKLVADRCIGLATRLGGVHGQVAARVPGPGDEHALALHVADVAVAAGVQHMALEAPRVVRHERVPEVPVGDD
jgi:hypothetical protein